MTILCTTPRPILDDRRVASQQRSQPDKGAAQSLSQVDTSPVPNTSSLAGTPKITDTPSQPLVFPRVPHFRLANRIKSCRVLDLEHEIHGGLQSPCLGTRHVQFSISRPREHLLQRKGGQSTELERLCISQAASPAVSLSEVRGLLGRRRETRLGHFNSPSKTSLVVRD